ncbi:MAG: transcription elongation factor GreA [Chitinophagales bacterium]|jgi:transcription elongation factor GreA|nr:transcription elongation factor GreA [Chitinophagales bacterium]MCO5281080.1 transcription elongation factor GreA [Chitinophagales bacterium]HRP40370.1 transcription elongation factor GreA [Chitinophagales bacterium]
MAIHYMTKEGYEALERELKYLSTVRRKEVANAIAEAREKGDLSENAEYHAAKEEQGYLEAKIVELETQFASARILDESKLDTSKVGVLSKVEILNKKTNKKMVFTIVSEAEANLKENKISSTSPIGAALLGKEVGDIAQAQTPAGILELKVLNISI